MNVPPTEQHPIPDGIRVFWINEYECWAGETLEACIEASMKEWGVTREEVHAEDAYEVPREDWDAIKCSNDPDEVVHHTPKETWAHRHISEIDWDKTSWETIRQSVASHDKFPVMICGRE